MASNVSKRLGIFVGNVSWTVSPGEFRNYFNRFGQIKHCKIVFNKEGWSRKYGFVGFSNKIGINQVLLQKEHYLAGQLLSINALDDMKKDTMVSDDLDIEAEED